VERSFGILKTRWRAIFLRYMEIRSLFAPKVVGACCILHNICMAAGDILEEEEEEEEDGPGDPVEADDRDLSGNALRARLAAQVSAPAGVDVCLAEHEYL
jgi:hypothetical protein